MCCHSHVLWNVCVPVFAHPYLVPAILVSPSMYTSTTPQTSLQTCLHIPSPCCAHPLRACWPLTALLTARQPAYTASCPWKPCRLPSVYCHHVTHIHAGPFSTCSVDDCDPPIPMPLLPGSPLRPTVAHAPPTLVLFFLFLFLPLTFVFVLTAVTVLCKPGCAVSAADTSSV